MTTLLCVDPGPKVSGAVIVDTEDMRLIEGFTEIGNEELMTIVYYGPYGHLTIEMISSYGMPVGREVFETVMFIGRMWEARRDDPKSLIYRKDIKLALCNSVRAKDSNIRRVILDQYPATGGGKTPQIGIKSKPGPLFGVAKHAWAALALGFAWAAENEGRKLC